MVRDIGDEAEERVLPKNRGQNCDVLQVGAAAGIGVVFGQVIPAGSTRYCWASEAR